MALRWTKAEWERAAAELIDKACASALETERQAIIDDMWLFVQPALNMEIHGLKTGEDVVDGA